ncbi:MAG TPA: hypothetical protein VGS27_16250 [Candidatus Sulfotelmatobacter sp.]|nr:hypothetical protein [Candidatus Sulfotelmatobacter sp.]
MLAGALVSVSLAQDDRPLIVPGERKPKQKKDVGPRAVGIVQLGAKGKASLVPIAILIDGKFWDASAYKADPVPMALDSGTVYEGERSGTSLGLFTVGSALHANNPSAAMPWLGTGVWRANGAEPATKIHKAESAPVGIEADSGPPRLTRDSNSAKPSAPASSSTPAASPGSSPGSPSGPPSGPSGGSSSSAPPASSGSGDEPPRLSRGSSSPPQSAPDQSSPSASAPAGQSKPDDSKSKDAKNSDSKPADTKPGDQEKSTQSKGTQPNIPTSDSGASESNRPILRRGKPVESFADEDIPGYSAPGAKPANAGNVVETVAANKPDVQLIPAISDAGGPVPHSFAYEWIPGDEEDRRKQMVDLAKDQVRKYVEARSKNNIAASSTHTAAAKRLTNPKLPDPILENMQMVAYDLWNSNQPVLILSAQAHMPAEVHATSEPDMEYSVVLVAYPDIYHNLHKLYSGVTDKFHLDVTPRLELIDVVDADGDGRGELLFRETSDQGAGWAIYRAGADKLFKMFDSLNPE